MSGWEGWIYGPWIGVVGTLLGVCLGSWISERREQARFRALVAALRPRGPMDTRLPTRVEIGDQPDGGTA